MEEETIIINGNTYNIQETIGENIYHIVTTIGLAEEFASKCIETDADFNEDW